MATMSPEETLDYYVNFVTANADEYKREFLTYSNDASEEAQNNITYISSLWRAGELNNLQLPGVDNVSFDGVVDLRSEFDSKYNSLFAILKRTVPNEFAYFINNFFPKPSNFDEIEKFLVDGILNGGIGLPEEIERQIWERSRQRIELSNNKQIMENRKSISSRGFIVPNGVEKYSELIIRNEGNKNIAGESSNVAIEAAKLRIDWVKNAIAEARTYRSIALDSAFKYLANILSIQDPSLRYASAYVDSHKTFHDSLNSYYNAVNTVSKLKLEKASLIDNRNLSYDKFIVDQRLSNEDQKTKTLISLAEMMAQQASSALSGINSLVTLGNNTVVNASQA